MAPTHIKLTASTERPALTTANGALPLVHSHTAGSARAPWTIRSADHATAASRCACPLGSLSIVSTIAGSEAIPARSAACVETRPPPRGSETHVAHSAQSAISRHAALARSNGTTVRLTSECRRVMESVGCDASHS